MTEAALHAPSGAQTTPGVRAATPAPIHAVANVDPPNVLPPSPPIVPCGRTAPAPIPGSQPARRRPTVAGEERRDGDVAVELRRRQSPTGGAPIRHAWRQGADIRPVGLPDRQSSVTRDSECRPSV